MEQKQYTREQLLDLLSGYKRMIERNKDTPTVLIDDLEKSINHVLSVNGHTENDPPQEEKPKIHRTRPLTPYERCRNAVYATGNRWAIENFNATH